jgi:hypothetical protein
MRIPLLPSYQLDKKSLQNITSLDELAEGKAFFGGKSLSEVITTQQWTLSVLLNDTDSEEKIIAAIRKAYPEHFVYTGAYMIGNEQKNGQDLVALHSAPLGMVSFPWGKAHDVAVLASVLGHRWEQIKERIPSTDLAELAPRFHEMMFTSTKKNKGAEMLGLEDPTVKTILKNKFGAKKIKKSEWISHLLSYTPETISEALSREVQEETWRDILEKNVAFAFLTSKGDHVLKANIVYTGTLGESDPKQIKHTYTEKKITKIKPFVWSEELIDNTAGRLVAGKLGLPGHTFEGNKKLQTEKLTVAVGYYIALQTYRLLKQDL